VVLLGNIQQKGEAGGILNHCIIDRIVNIQPNYIGELVAKHVAIYTNYLAE